MNCPNCGHPMNHHADKLLWEEIEPTAESGSQLLQAYSCPHCGANAARLTEG